MTYGWMLLVVAIVGGAIFSVVQSQSVDSVSGFSGGDVLIDDFGVTSGDELGLEVRDGSGQGLTVSRVNVSDPETGEWVFKEFTGENRVAVGDSRIFELPNVSRTDSGNVLNVEIVYDSGGLSNLSVSGTISGDLEVTDTGSYEGLPEGDHEEVDNGGENGGETVSSSGAPSFDTAPSGEENEDEWVPVSLDSGTDQGFDYFFDESDDPEYFSEEEGFYVMKYEAKAYDTSTDSFVSDGCGDGDCSTDDWADESVEPRSVAANKPWREISFNEDGAADPYGAFQACEALNEVDGVGGDYEFGLVTNREWMTVSRQVEQNSANWVDTSDGSDASVGAEGAGIYRGNSGGFTALDINLDDEPNAAGDDGQTERTHELANGEVVWDLSGNVRQWVDLEEDGTALGDNDDEDWNVTESGDNQFWDEVSGFKNGFSRNSGSDTGNDLKRELGPIDDSWGQTEGTGYLWDDRNSPRAAMRGSHWYGGDYAGVFNANSHTPDYSNSNFGFRCSAVPVS